MARKKHYKESDALKTFNRKSWIYTAIFILIWLGLLFYLKSPKTLEFRNSIIGRLLLCSVITAICLVVAFLKSNEIPWLGKWVLIGYAFLYTLFTFVSLGRYTLLVFYIFGIISIIIAILLYFREHISFTSVIFVGCLSLLSAFMVVLDLKTVSEFTFLLPTLIPTAVLTIISIFLTIKFSEKLSKQNRVFVPIATLFISFIGIWMSLNLFNFVFDNSLPSFETYEIIEKEINSGARSPTTYDLTVKNSEREFEISVSETSYYSLSVGDQIIITFYEGALNEAYYVYEPNKNQE